MPTFQLHPQLAEDCHQIGRLRHCHLLLHRNAALPWFILVPETDAKDFLDLPAELRHQIDDECAAVSRFIKSEFGSPKINFAAIGNLVPQMHLHVIGRHPEDPCWPHPVWGNLKSESEYSDEQIVRLAAAARQLT